jgi:hypothetical protein
MAKKHTNVVSLEAYRQRKQMSEAEIATAMGGVMAGHKSKSISDAECVRRLLALFDALANDAKAEVYASLSRSHQELLSRGR